MEREREREKEKERATERPGPRVNNKGTSVPAPGRAQLGGGWRAEEANEDKEEWEWVEGWGARERTLAQEPWPTLILILQKNRLHIDLGLGRHQGRLQLHPGPPLTPAFLPQIGQGSALNKQFYKSWWSLVLGRGQMWTLKRPRAENPQQVKNRRSIRSLQTFTVTVVEEKDPNTPLQSRFRSALLMFTVGEEGKHGNGEKIGN